MFFSWYLENRHFRERGGFKGQITPLLLVIIVILLIAAISTVNIGRVSIDKTCSANGADAGSLAAASLWAGALNSLAETNKALRENYDINYFAYGVLYDTAADAIEEAIMYALIGVALVAIATYAISTYKQVCCPIKWEMLVASVMDGLAAWAIFESYIWTSIFNMTAQYMQSLTETFHEDQLEFYCEIIESMKESHLAAEKSAFTFAFSNSCISAKLSEGQDDSFQSWLSSDGPYDDRNYNWQDKIGQSHNVSVTLDLPDITSYELQHTVGTYSEIDDLLDTMITRSSIIASVLYNVSITLGVISLAAALSFLGSVIGHWGCTCCVGPIPPPICCTMMVWGCNLDFYMYTWVVGDHYIVVAILAGLVTLAGAISLYLLQDKNDEAFDKWGPNGSQSSVTCADASDLLIVQISEVIMPKWNASCCATQQHPGTSAGIVSTSYPSITSCSSSKFSGGDVGSFDSSYDSEIISAY